MATNNSVGGLYLRLGLNLSELETGFVTASQTVAANIARLNREANLIRLRTEVEIAGLDEATDGERILQLRTQSLNQQMQIQRDRIRILNAELTELTRTHGANATATQRATVRLERERLALANLERDLRNLNSSSNGTGSFGELSDLLPSMPTKLQAVGAALTAVTSGIGAAAAATKALLDEFHELQNQSYELNMSFSDTRNFLREMKLAGGDIGDIEGYIRGITDAFVKGEWDDPEFIALRKHGAEITDATGRLKSFKDITEEVYQAWLKADAAGEGIEFLQLTGGEMGVRDIIQYFQRLKEAREDADKIFTAKIDEKQLHELDRTLNLVTEQSKELKAALGDIFVPAAQAAAEKFFQILHNGTQTLVENKDALQKWQFVAAEIFDTIADKASKVSDKIAEIAKTPKGTTGNVETDRIMSGMSWRYQEFSQQTPWQGKEPWKNFPNPESNHVLDDFYQRVEERQKALTKSWADFRKEVEAADKKLADNNPLNQYAQKRIQDFRDELEDLQIELDFGGKDYLKSLAQLDLWNKRESAYKNFLSDEEQKVIDDLYAAKFDKIKQEQAEKVQQYWQNAADIEYEMTHTAFEKELRDIERWKEAQQEKASTAEEVQAVIAESAAKEAQAFEREMDRIKGTLQSLEDKIFEQEHSQYENDLRRLQQERLRYYEDYQKKGILNDTTRAMIERYYQNAVGKLNQRAAESRAKDSDYTKSPNGGMNYGGNGIVVIGADKIFDDGLIRGQQQQIELLADENQIRAQFMQTLPQETRERLAAIEATRQLTDAQRNLIQSTNQAAGGFQIIEGDKVVNQPTAPQPVLPQTPTTGFQAVAGDRIVADVEHFGDAVNQTANALEQSDSTKILADAQKKLADSVNALPPDYFKSLADGTKAVSEMQLRLTDSTMHLIDAQDKLAAAIVNLPTVNQTRDTNQRQSDNGMMKLNYSTQNLQDAQSRLVATTRDVDARLRDISDIPPQSKIAQRDNGIKFGIDYDTFKDVLLTGVGLAGGAMTTGVGTAAVPAIAVGTLATAIAAAIGKGTYDATTAAPNLPVEADLSQLLAPLSNVDAPLSTILQQMQDAQPREDDRLQELFGTLPNIEAGVNDILLDLQARAEQQTADYLTPLNSIDVNLQSVLQALQAPQAEATAIDYLTPITAIDGKLQSVLDVMPRQETISFETVVTPLNNIASIVGNILTALNSRQPPQITISPSNNVNLGGAYVFDNAMKQSLVNDITTAIVDKITDAVQQAVGSSNYSFGA